MRNSNFLGNIDRFKFRSTRYIFQNISYNSNIKCHPPPISRTFITRPCHT